MRRFLVGVAVGWVLSNNLAIERRYALMVKLSRRYSTGDAQGGEPLWLRALDKLI